MNEFAIVKYFTTIDFNKYTHLFFVISTNMFLLILGLILIYIVFRRKQYIQFSYFLFLAILGYVLKKLIALFYTRARPYILLKMQGSLHITNSSFYSMHTFLAFLMAFFIFRITKHRWVGLTAFVFATFVAISRIVLAMHFLTDVLFSIFFVYCLIVFLDWWENWRENKKQKDLNKIL